jgi:hypothetical protein
LEPSSEVDVDGMLAALRHVLMLAGFSGGELHDIPLVRFAFSFR